MEISKTRMIKELKQKKSLYNVYKNNIIDLDEYFAYSGKIEVKGKFIDKFDEYTYKEKTIIKNDMSKYVLNKNKKSETKIK